MRIALFALLLGACCSTPAPKPALTQREPEPKPLIPNRPQGGQSIEDAFPPERLARTGYDIVVLTIVETEKRSGTTNGKPPELKVRIDEVLAGKATVGEKPGVWSPPPSGIDWTGESARQARAEWEARPLPAPEAGVKLIVLGREVDGIYRISAKLRTPYSDDDRKTWLERIDRAQHGPE